MQQVLPFVLASLAVRLYTSTSSPLPLLLLIPSFLTLLPPYLSPSPLVHRHPLTVPLLFLCLLGVKSLPLLRSSGLASPPDLAKLRVIASHALERAKSTAPLLPALAADAVAKVKNFDAKVSRYI